MAKRQTVTDKIAKKTNDNICPVCAAEVQYIRHVKAVKTEAGAWKFRSVNTGVCKCNEKEIYV